MQASKTYRPTAGRHAPEARWSPGGAVQKMVRGWLHWQPGWAALRPGPQGWQQQQWQEQAQGALERISGPWEQREGNGRP